MWDRICTFIGIVIFTPDVYIFYSDAGSEVVFRNRQVMVTSFGCYSSGGASKSPDCWGSCNVQGKTGEGEMENDRGMVMVDECVVYIRNLGGRLVLIFTRAGILVCVVGVVVVGVVFFRERSLSVTEVECLGVGVGLVGGGIFDLGGDFVAVVVKKGVEDFELVVKTVVRLVGDCLSGSMYLHLVCSYISSSKLYI